MVPSDRAQPADTSTTAGPVHFRCSGCGAELHWDPELDVLLCDHCALKVEVPRAEGTVLERPLEAAGAAARGWGAARRSSRCSGCGASVSFDGLATATACVFCGQAQVLEQSENRNALRPESLIPLDVARDRVEEAFRKWISRRWFAPSALRRARASNARGVYVPFWTFDCRVHSEWSADAGYTYWVKEPTVVTVNGRSRVEMRNVPTVRWVPAWGRRDDAYDDLVVCGSKGLATQLVDELGKFDMQSLVPYRAEYLAGWSAEEYDLDLEQAWRVGQERVERTQLNRCDADVPGDTHRGLRVHNRIDDVRWKQVLLPFWTLSYAWRSKTYTVVVHGQNARIAGEAPRSAWKIAGLVIALLAAAASIAWVAS